ncbi:hypothetical protein ACFLUO_05925 [Chloroflexota bacterium]
MAESREGGITVLRGLKGYEFGKIIEDAEETMAEVKLSTVQG